MRPLFAIFLQIPQGNFSHQLCHHPIIVFHFDEQLQQAVHQDNQGKEDKCIDPAFYTGKY